MSGIVTVREFARLTTGEVGIPSLDRNQVSASAFDWLCKLSSAFGRSGASLVQITGQRWLQLENYVGVIETPCGTKLEILPKHYEDEDSLEASRSLLLKMMTSALDLPTREVGKAQLRLFKTPLSEWLIDQFLRALDHLIVRGVSSEYRRIEEEQRYLKGQLNFARQMRERPERQHYFQIRHEIATPNRAENRLLKLALDRVCKATQVPSNWRLAHELRSLLLEIPPSNDVHADFRNWRNDKLTNHYQQVRPWCELILNQQMPTAVAGEWKGISLLFPMEKLFERYVANCLRKRLVDGAIMRTQSNAHHLVEHMGGQMFRLQPDIVIDRGAHRWVMDTKWKLIDSADRRNNYGLKQSDFYQLFAYGHKYLNDYEGGGLVLIYPRRSQFARSLPTFSFSERMQLWVVPFNLEKEDLEYPSTLNVPFGSHAAEAPGFS